MCDYAYMQEMYEEMHQDTGSFGIPKRIPIQFSSPEAIIEGGGIDGLYADAEVNLPGIPDSLVECTLIDLQTMLAQEEGRL